MLTFSNSVVEHMLSSAPLRWRHNGHNCVSNHQPRHCLLNRLFERRSKKTSKLRVTGLCARNSPGTGEFPAQMASNAENVSIWWRHHAFHPYFLEFNVNDYSNPYSWRVSYHVLLIHIWIHINRAWWFLIDIFFTFLTLFCLWLYMLLPEKSCN